ncbi:hypothetical protein, partial [Megasphaera elsdenii]|uniref:hypothetical protein n=2 Tax=Megasphaera TaxID=906 RepID=UPI001980E754
MGLNLKVFSANYKLCATNYKITGASHDGKNHRTTAPFIVEAVPKGNVSKLAFIKNMKRLLHEIMQWSLFSYIKIPPRLRFLGFR